MEGTYVCGNLERNREREREIVRRNKRKRGREGGSEKVEKESEGNKDNVKSATVNLFSIMKKSSKCF